MRTISSEFELPNYEGPPPNKYEMEQIFAGPLETAVSARYVFDSWRELVIIRGDTTYHVKPGMKINGVVACCARHHVGGNDSEPCAGVNPEAAPRVCWDQHGSIVAPVAVPEYEPLFGPVILTFDPVLTCETDNGAEEAGVPWRDIWNDPLVRSIWLVVASHYAKSQHFRQQCIESAGWFRKFPPIVANNIGTFTDFGCSDLQVKTRLYPYVVRCLMDEGRWPYLSPPAALLAPGPTPWKFVPKEA